MHGVSRLTNRQYAHDVLLYAKSLQELESMTERVLEALKPIGLSLNTTKTKIIRCNVSEDDSSLNFVEIDGEFVKVLSDADSHRYLGKLLCTSATERVVTEFRNRKRVAWADFAKHNAVLLDHNVYLKLRLKYFATSIGSAILFGTPVMPMTKVQLQEMDRIQRKMLRRTVGWRRVDDEPWNETMTPLNLRLGHGHALYYCQPWSMIFARSQWRYVLHIIDAYPLLWARTMCKYNYNPQYDPESDHLPHRTAGRPRQRWDDNIHAFVWKTWPHYHGRHWFDILSQHRLSNYDDEYVLFLAKISE